MGQKGKHAVNQQGHRSCGDAPDQNTGPVLCLETGENEVAKAGLAYCRCERGSAEGPDRGRAYARQYDRRRQRKFDEAKPLPSCHAKAVGDVQRDRVDLLNPGHPIPQNRQEGIEEKRQQGRKEA